MTYEQRQQIREARNQRVRATVHEAGFGSQGQRSLAEACYQATQGDPCQALWLAVQQTARRIESVQRLATSPM